MKFSLKKFTLFILFLWLYCHLPLQTSAQQKNPEQKISISATNEPVSQVLDRLSRNTGITFSYNPDHIDASRLITLNLKEKSLSEIISAILPPDKFGFRYSGNQVIVYRKTILSETREDQVSNLPDNGIESIRNIRPDTVFLTQTKIQRDTIAVTDTIVKFDTVYMMRTIVREPIGSKDIFSNLTNLPKEQTREIKTEAGISFNWMGALPVFTASSEFEGKLDEYKKSNSGSTLAGSAGIDLRFNYARFCLATGVSFTIFNNKLDYNYEISTGGFFRKDTLDRYYTLIEEDTTWYYVLDSTYLPVNKEAVGYESLVNHRYLEIPFSIQYNHPLNRMLIYAKAGLIAGFHTGSNGYFIKPDENGVLKMNEVEFRPMVLSYSLGLGLLMPLSGRLTLDGGFTYRQNITSILSDFPIEIMNRAFGVKAGLIYKF